MWYSKFLCICALITFIYCKDENPKKNVEPKLKFVFVTVRGPAHWPCDYPGGPTIFGRSEFTSRLSWRGRNDAYDYGVEIGKMYKEKFGIKKWTKDKYWSFASGSPRTQQAALVLAAGLENKRYKKDRIWSIAKKNSTQFPAMQEYTKFYSAEKCPRFFQELEVKYPIIKDEVIKAIAVLKEKIVPKRTAIQTPQDIWLAYESLYNVFYSYRKKNYRKMKYWKRIRSELKQYSKLFMWSSLTADEIQRKLASEPENNERRLSILTVPQGIFAALVTGFAPNGTTIDAKLFDPDDLYPEHGAMHIIELYQTIDNKWQVKILYRKKKKDCLKALRLPGCNKKGKLPPNFCALNHLKSAVNEISLEPVKHDKLCKDPAEFYK
ncbi:uncharacterized protein LOC113385882 [Ctenocephalides felis]|uniref:uncharacterized protein LOC113385882 n=1 Tax=Ctenocephalides felis TaxID=7515 RepID=UPI000E6E2B36|nr:uncharacterized protein LOC113385882 [Ctenocephalides felis]